MSNGSTCERNLPARLDKEIRGARRKACFLNFFRNCRQVGHSPRHDDAVGLRKVGMKRFQQMAVRLADKVIPELFLNMARPAHSVQTTSRPGGVFT
jgi:hypothetical protein